MKKINLNEYVKTSNFIKPVSTEDINGGCILVLGCNNYGFYKKSYTYKCDKVSAHTKAAIAYANSHKYDRKISGYRKFKCCISWIIIK